jgi:mannose-1-phosphate guanylyltransferase
MKAVIQAGGQGTRLRPYTLILPKPMMPVGGVPVIESLLKWLRRNGIEEAYITTGYLGHLLKSLIGDGSQWDMDIAYSEEKEPMGTVGALRLVEDQLDETFLVLNGDLVTDLDLNAFRDYHRSHGGLLSIAVTSKTVKVDLGVLDTDNLSRVTLFREKPSIPYQVSMGMYCMEPEILKHIPKGVAFGFDNLVHILLEKKIPIHVFQHDGLWMDIGRPEDFQKAQELVDSSEEGLYIPNNSIDQAT